MVYSKYKKGYFARREFSLEKEIIKNCVLFVFLKCKKGCFSKNVLETLKIGVFFPPNLYPLLGKISLFYVGFVIIFFTKKNKLKRFNENIKVILTQIIQIKCKIMQLSPEKQVYCVTFTACKKLHHSCKVAIHCAVLLQECRDVCIIRHQACVIRS